MYFKLAHDTLGHWGNVKSYAAICSSYYWPHMQKELKTTVAMDFVGPLPEDDDFNCILTITDFLGSDLHIVPCRTDILAKDLATLFFQTNGSSERSNRTIIQAIRFHVKHNQQGWAHALPLVRFNHMNTINASTGFTPFQLHSGRHPRVIPPLVFNHTERSPNSIGAAKFIKQLDTNVMEVQDNLLLTKSNQAYHVDKAHRPETVYANGDKVML
ncbi:hypothetical protein EW026_g4344 [Hermanssonia centrifuga]|uniref:Integrase zinc-binding domain-containing protein n=1 Tax=Hermanssonia centrifuga TaxID=98765 RepID=A0A4S4KHG1_9APHY|nr:hypothetical protein EW026_g4344 [Hermanssonia centrifuga]